MEENENVDKKKKIKIVKDFYVFTNDYKKQLLEGEDLPDDFPKIFLQNLITEKVIKIKGVK